MSGPTVTGPTRALLLARHTGCRKMAAKYWGSIGIDDYAVHGGEWRRVPASDKGCSCAPPPTLPDGAVLAAEVALALSRPMPADTFRAPRTIPC